MGGGPSTPELVIAAAEAGALGFLAGAYRSAASMQDEIAAVRAATQEAFGVNLFVPGAPTVEPEAVDRYLDELRPEAEARGCSLADPAWDDDGWDEKLEAVLVCAPPLVSFTFGCPEQEVVSALQAGGSMVAVTVTTSGEAVLASDRGADALCVQGFAAGGHRASFYNDDRCDPDVPLLGLIAALKEVTDLPQIAAGGICDAEQVRAVLAAGAVAAQCGTAFLRCPESGAGAGHKAALADGRFTSTAVTRAFSGRRARGLANQFMADHPHAPVAYPEINNATRPLRSVAAAAGDLDAVNLWAGTGFSCASERNAGEIVEALTA